MPSGGAASANPFEVKAEKVIGHLLPDRFGVTDPNGMGPCRICAKACSCWCLFVGETNIYPAWARRAQLSETAAAGDPRSCCNTRCVSRRHPEWCDTGSRPARAAHG